MKIRTKRSKFAKALVINAGVLEKLYTGNAKIDEVKEPHLKREGSELLMSGAKAQLDIFKNHKRDPKTSRIKTTKI